MYLYYDRNGVLKEIINDKALRQGNFGVNKLYIYVDRTDFNGAAVSYLLPSNLVVGGAEGQWFDDFEDLTIPLDNKRDLRWFKYGQTYHFLVVDLSEKDINNHYALEEAGLVHCSITLYTSDEQLSVLGGLNFEVEVNAVLNQKQVGCEEYMSLADYQYIIKELKKFVPYTGATGNVDLGEFGIFGEQISANGSLTVGDLSGSTYIDIQNNYILVMNDGVETDVSFPSTGRLENIAYQSYVDNKCKMYRHTITIYNDRRHTQKVVLVYEDMNPERIDDLSLLRERVFRGYDDILIQGIIDDSDNSPYPERCPVFLASLDEDDFLYMRFVSNGGQMWDITYSNIDWLNDVWDEVTDK